MPDPMPLPWVKATQAHAVPAGGPGQGRDVGPAPLLRAAVLDFVQETVARYRDNPALVAWQVENEPLNPAGPHRWQVSRDTLGAEVAALKAIDSRPVIVNAFGHFNI